MKKGEEAIIICQQLTGIFDLTRK